MGDDEESLAPVRRLEIQAAQLALQGFQKLPSRPIFAAVLDLDRHLVGAGRRRQGDIRLLLIGYNRLARDVIAVVCPQPQLFSQPDLHLILVLRLLQQWC